ncbi:hypothetical protein J3U01_08470 [Bifidobacterium sp. B4107]|uniref:hypothetical protein n=1 Tax=unclassified Bifidobacterium TaxID=2608897 RepID=UPI00226B5C8B|nr:MULTISPECIES: hypothetical protein [unclassified Bifidobacterium]MCX8648432.1 hypothetical protein [Bifidobacterium sp. B4107]MCX8652576.1 hypothetical protein [Bifidobacterium sp. B4111]MCX8659060.1 hypothetical protein [Bifidobacterium sp. B4114]
MAAEEAPRQPRPHRLPRQQRRKGRKAEEVADSIGIAGCNNTADRANARKVVRVVSAD